MSITRVYTSSGWVDLQGGASGIGMIPGVVVPYAGAAAPAGYAICDGTAKKRTGTDPDGKDYSNLFSVIGTQYGVGDASTTFNLPDLKGKVVAGVSAGETEFDTLGETGGAKTHTLTSAQMPVHTHTQDAHQHKLQTPAGVDMSCYRHFPDEPESGAGNVVGWYYNASPYAHTNDITAVNQNAGSGGSHPNLQPYMALNYLIKL